MDVRQEKLSRWKPLLFVWEVTSHQTTSGQSLKNRRAGKIVQAIAMNKVSESINFLSLLSSFTSFSICFKPSMVHASENSAQEPPALLVVETVTELTFGKVSQFVVL